MKVKWHFVTEMLTACSWLKLMDTNADVRMDTVEMVAMATVLTTAKISAEMRALV